MSTVVAERRNVAAADGRALPSYPEYRDSGVEWLGSIPAHWDVRRLKTVAHVELSNVDKNSVQGQVAVMLCNYTHVYNNDRITPDLDFMAATATPDQVRRFSLREGDVLITKDSESWTDIAVPAVVAADLPNVVCGYHLALVRPQMLDLGPYLALAMSAYGPRHQFHPAANGVTRFGLSADAIRTSLFAIPPIEERRAILGFIERETARIDALVAKKQRLARLLFELRMNLVTRSVTKGLDRDVPMKESGIDWIGQVPAGWKASALKRIGMLKAGSGFPEAEQGLEGEELPFFKVGDMKVSGNERQMVEHQNSISRLTAESLSAFIFPPGTVVFAKIGAALLLNRRRVLARDACLDNNMMGFVPTKCDPTWAYYWLSSLDIRPLAKPGAVPSVDEGQLGTTSVIVPPLVEQRRLAAFLDAETADLSAGATRVVEAIERLKELRTALVSAAVTGKIDVRREV